MSIQNNLLKFKASIPENVTLVAVSKTKPVEDLMEAYHAGQRVFGENKIQEMTDKWKVMPKDIEWHMIGHVQTNKVRFMAPYVKLIHSIDSFKLLTEINKQAKANNRVIDCLLQVYIANEETKFGLNELELENLLHSEDFKALNNIQIVGFMGMATFTEDKEQIKNEFNLLKTIFETYKAKLIKNCNLSILSMGMSGDYKIAIDCGSTMIRIGSSIFGSR